MKLHVQYIVGLPYPSNWLVLIRDPSTKIVIGKTSIDSGTKAPIFAEGTVHVKTPAHSPLTPSPPATSSSAALHYTKHNSGVVQLEVWERHNIFSSSILGHCSVNLLQCCATMVASPVQYQGHCSATSAKVRADGSVLVQARFQLVKKSDVAQLQKSACGASSLSSSQTHSVEELRAQGIQVHLVEIGMVVTQDNAASSSGTSKTRAVPVVQPSPMTTSAEYSQCQQASVTAPLATTTEPLTELSPVHQTQLPPQLRFPPPLYLQSPMKPAGAGPPPLQQQQQQLQCGASVKSVGSSSFDTCSAPGVCYNNGVVARAQLSHTSPRANPPSGDSLSHTSGGNNERLAFGRSGGAVAADPPATQFNNNARCGCCSTSLADGTSTNNNNEDDEKSSELLADDPARYALRADDDMELLYRRRIHDWVMVPLQLEEFGPDAQNDTT